MTPLCSNTAYADAKLFVAWWAAALALKIPADMAVYAVSLGSAPDTQAVRNLGFVMKHLMMPILKLIPAMAQTTDEAAKIYLAASKKPGGQVLPISSKTLDLGITYISPDQLQHRSLTHTKTTSRYPCTNLAISHPGPDS